jgi:hypothetical protein
MMGRRRQGNDTSQKDNSIEDLVRNEENEYQFLTPNKTMTNGLSDAHKKISQNGNHGRHQ